MDKQADDSYLYEFHVTLMESETTSGQWEFTHPDKIQKDNKYYDLYPNQTDNLPPLEYPITHKVKKWGEIVICNNDFKGAFHRYDDNCRYGKHFYIGSPFQTLRGKSGKLWRDFVGQFGVHTGIKIECKLQIFSSKRFVFKRL